MKRTPAEEEARARKKARREARRVRREARRSALSEGEDGVPTPDAGPSTSTSSRRSPGEDAKFEEKLRDAFAEDMHEDVDSRLDNLATRLGEYSHIPRRWH